MKKFLTFIVSIMLCIGIGCLFAGCDFSLDDLWNTEDDKSPQITVPENTENAIVLRYTSTENTVTVKVSVEGTVHFAGITGTLNYDSGSLNVTDSKGSVNGIVVNTAKGGAVSFSYASATDITEQLQLFEVTFSYTGSVDTKLTVEIKNGNFSDASFNDVPYTVIGGDIKVG